MPWRATRHDSTISGCPPPERGPVSRRPVRGGVLVRAALLLFATAALPLAFAQHGGHNGGGGGSHASAPHMSAPHPSAPHGQSPSPAYRGPAYGTPAYRGAPPGYAPRPYATTPNRFPTAPIAPGAPPRPIVRSSPVSNAARPLRRSARKCGRPPSRQLAAEPSRAVVRRPGECAAPRAGIQPPAAAAAAAARRSPAPARRHAAPAAPAHPRPHREHGAAEPGPPPGCAQLGAGARQHGSRATAAGARRVPRAPRDACPGSASRCSTLRPTARCTATMSARCSATCSPWNPTHRGR